jgi:hypothetical protein
MADIHDLSPSEWEEQQLMAEKSLMRVVDGSDGLGFQQLTVNAFNMVNLVDNGPQINCMALAAAILKIRELTGKSKASDAPLTSGQA